MKTINVLEIQEIKEKYEFKDLEIHFPELANELYEWCKTNGLIMANITTLKTTNRTVVFLSYFEM